MTNDHPCEGCGAPVHSTSVSYEKSKQLGKVLCHGCLAKIEHEKDLAQEAPDLQAIDTMLAAMKEAQHINTAHNTAEKHRMKKLTDRVLIYRAEIHDRLRMRGAERDAMQAEIVTVRAYWNQISKQMHGEIRRLQNAVRGVVEAFDKGQPVDVHALETVLETTERVLGGNVTTKPA